MICGNSNCEKSFGIKKTRYILNNGLASGIRYGMNVLLACGTRYDKTVLKFSPSNQECTVCDPYFVFSEIYNKSVQNKGYATVTLL